MVLGRAHSAFYAAKFKRIKNTGDLTYSKSYCALGIRSVNLLKSVNKEVQTTNFEAFFLEENPTEYLLPSNILLIFLWQTPEFESRQVY